MTLLVTAPLGRRLAARAVDEVVLAVLTLPVVVVGAVTIATGAYDDVRRRVERNVEQGVSTASAFDAVQTWRIVSGIGERLALLLVVLAVLRAVYTAGSVTLLGGTPGKRALGLRVVPVTQDPLVRWQRPTLVSALLVGATGPAVLAASLVLPLLLALLVADWAAVLLDKRQARSLRERAGKVRTVWVRGAGSAAVGGGVVAAVGGEVLDGVSRPVPGLPATGP